MTNIAACHRTNAHAPHGQCLGTAPEFPSEAVETVNDEAKILLPMPNGTAGWLVAGDVRALMGYLGSTA